MPNVTLAQSGFSIAARASVAAWLLSCSASTLANPPTSTTAPADQTADKSQYTLFTPAPASVLRDMDTDRPNKTNTPHTVDAGHLQIEAGAFDYVYDRNRYEGADAQSNSLDLGQLNCRLGILNDLELNVSLNAYNYLWAHDSIAKQSSRQYGLGDTVVGGKLNLWGDDGGDDAWQTALAIQPQFKIPTARGNLGNGHPELAVGLPFLMNLPRQFHLGLQTTPSWQRTSQNTGYTTALQNSASLDRVFFEKFDIYLEYWSLVTAEHHQEAQQTIDIGVTVPVGDNIVLDTGFNFGLSRNSSTFEWLSGLSVRF
jgi:hypothetical protein